MVSEPRPTSGGLKVKPAAAAGVGSTPAAKTPTPQTAGQPEQKEKYKRVTDLKELLSTPNTKMTYAVIKARNNVIITLQNRNGLIKANICTALTNKFVNGFNVRELKRVILALNDLYNELTTIHPDINSERGKVRVY